jgi:peptide/nickel transport system substrate-binding protein
MTARVAAAAAERDPERRRAAYEDLQREHQRTSPFLYMFQLIEVAAHRSDVSGYEIGPTADTNFFGNIVKN